MSASTAQLVGSIGRLLVEPASGRVVAAGIEGAVGPATVLAWDSVSAIGPDAVMIESFDQLTEPGGQPSGALTDLYELNGRPVLTERGDSMGRLEDVEVDEESGRVVGLVVPGRSLPLERFVALGRDAVIVPAPAPG
jgi:sporulation protein YlmC with PRC-barrel domain